MPDAGQPTSHRRRHGRSWGMVVAVAVIAVAVGYAVVRVLGSQDDGSSPGATASRTPLARVDVSGLTVARTSPCDDVDRGGVEDALGDPVAVSERYQPGDRVRLSGSLRDVSREFGCTYRDAGGAEARLWVFEQPVDRSTAAGIVRDEGAKKGCRVVRGGPAFGSPRLTTSCPAQAQGRSIAERGLFGDAWLTCQLTVPAGDAGADPVRRTQRWCVDVVTRLSS
jgi:hypothetical protein